MRAFSTIGLLLWLLTSPMLAASDPQRAWILYHAKKFGRPNLTKEGEKEIFQLEANARNTIQRLGRKPGWSTDDFVVGEEITVGGRAGTTTTSTFVALRWPQAKQ